MHLFHERAEEAEVEEGGGAEARAVCCRMHVRNVRTDGEMNGDGDALFVGSDENTGGGVLYCEDAAVEELAGGFAVADVKTGSEFREFVDVLASFAGHAELAGAEASFDVFGSISGESDFEIMHECGAVHGNARDEAAFHQIDEDRTEADFDYVAADSPENGGALFAGAMDGSKEITKILGGKNVWKRIEEFCKGNVSGCWLGEIVDADFAFAGGERIGMDGTKSERRRGIDAH